MQKANKYIATIILMLFAVLVLVTPLVGGVGVAHASTNNYSYVLYDLQKDSKFDETLYPENKDDYSLQVIQIAESVDDELFVYVYQPSGKTADLRATSINISKGSKTLDFFNYKLTFINSHKTLYKYKVDDFEVEDARTRYYDITSIYRAWNEDYGDNETGNDNTISEVSFAVSKIFTIGIVDGNLIYDCSDVETIKVVSKYVGYIEYLNGFKWWISKCDSHYVAFDTDKQIDMLYEADVAFIPIAYKKWRNLVGSESFEYKKPADEPTKVTLTNEDTAQNPVGLWGNQYEWTRIERVDDFIKNEDLTDSAKQILSDKKWVLRFYESERKELLQALTGNTAITGTLVEDVTILRLKFETDGVVYNLGVVDNKQSETAGQAPSNNPDDFNFWGSNAKDLKRIIKIVLAVLAGIVVIIVVCWVIRIIAVPTKAISKAVKATKKKNKR